MLDCKFVNIPNSGRLVKLFTMDSMDELSAYSTEKHVILSDDSVPVTTLSIKFIVVPHRILADLIPIRPNTRLDSL